MGQAEGVEAKKREQRVCFGLCVVTRRFKRRHAPPSCSTVRANPRRCSQVEAVVAAPRRPHPRPTLQAGGEAGPATPEAIFWQPRHGVFV
eukprot:2009617-Pyramimonas_sp.AAC.1